MLLEGVMVTGVLTMSFCLSWMFQCVKCEVSQSRGGGAALPEGAPEAIRGTLHVQPVPV